MNSLLSGIKKLKESDFITGILKLRRDEGEVRAYAVAIYLDNPDLESIRDQLGPPSDQADVGQVGCLFGLPVCHKPKLAENRLPIAVYDGITFTYWVYYEVPPASQFRDWVQGRHENDKKKQAALNALDTFEKLSQRSSIGHKDLIPVIEAARSPYFVSWDVGIFCLKRIAAKHTAARDALWKLATDSKADLRLRSIGGLTDHLPKSFCLKVLRRGLGDRSKLVRGTAACASRILLLTEILPQLTESIDLESEETTLFELQLSVAIIRDGYHNYTGPDGTPVFVVRLSDGVPAELFFPGPHLWNQDDIDRRGANVVAEELRRQRVLLCGSNWRRFDWPNEVNIARG